MSTQTDALTQYLKNINKSPLLTSEQEIFLATKIQEMIAITGTVPSEGLRDIDLSVYNPEQVNTIKTGIKAYKHFAECNLRLVVSIAKRSRNKGLAYSDLISHGNIGLMRAIEKFDPKKNFRFSTYAYWWIKQHIQRAITNYSRTIRLPINISDNLDKILREREKYFREHKRQPTLEELSVSAKMSMKDLLHALNSDRSFVSLNQFFRDDNHTLEEVVPDMHESIVEQDNDEIKKVHHVLQRMNPDQSVVLKMFWGIDYDRPHEEKEIADILQFSKLKVNELLETGKKEFKNIFDNYES